MARPVYTLEAGFGSNPDDPLSAQAWTDITRYLDVQAGVTVRRGRDDEFSRIQPGKLAATLVNDGRFTMARTSGPYGANVLPGKLVRLGLCWPGGTVGAEKNYAQNVCIDTGAAAGWVAGGAVPPANIQAANAVAPPTGTHYTAVIWDAGNGSATLTVRGLVSGRTYTLQANLMAPTGSPHFTVTVAGNMATTTVLNVWQAKTITFVASGNFADVVITPNTVPAAGNIARFNALNIEEGNAATAFTSVPGTFSWRITAPSDAWPLTWQGGAAVYAETKLTATDKLAKLGELGEFRVLLQEDGLANGPVAYYPLTEGPGAAAVFDISGNAQPALTVFQAGSGGALTFGGATATYGGVEMNTVPPWYAGKLTGLAVQPATATSGKYLRAALNAPTAGTLGATIVAYCSRGAGTPSSGTVAAFTAADGSWFALDQNGSFELCGTFFDARTGVQSRKTFGFFTSAMDMFAAVLDIPGANQLRITLFWQGTSIGSPLVIATSSPVPKWTQVSIGGRNKDPFAGTISHVQFFDQVLTAAQLERQDAIARLGQTTTLFAERVTDRLGHLCRYAKLDTLQTAGAATPKPAGPQEIDGNPITAINKLEATEDGVFQLRGDGFPELQLRDYRFNAQPALTVDAGKLDPGALTFRGDDFGLVNDATATGVTGGQARVVNQAGVNAVGRRRVILDTVAITDDNLRSLAGRAVNANSTLRNRITGVTLSLLNDRALIRGALLLDVGKKIAITGLPGQAPSASLELYVEGYEEKDGENEWTLALNTSPAEPWNVWQLGVAGHSELGSTTWVAE